MGKAAIGYISQSDRRLDDEIGRKHSTNEKSCSFLPYLYVPLLHIHRLTVFDLIPSPCGETFESPFFLTWLQRNLSILGGLRPQKCTELKHHSHLSRWELMEQTGHTFNICSALIWNADPRVHFKNQSIMCVSVLSACAAQSSSNPKY